MVGAREQRAGVRPRVLDTPRALCGPPLRTPSLPGGRGGLYLWRAEQELVEVLQPRLNAMQDAAADGAPPLQSLRKGVRQALRPGDEREDGTQSPPHLTPCPASPLIISRLVWWRVQGAVRHPRPLETVPW